MATVLIHVLNEEPILGEIDELPKPTDTIIIVKNPRKRDSKDLHYIAANVTTVIWPLSRAAFIEVMPSAEEDNIIGFVREK